MQERQPRRKPQSRSGRTWTGQRSETRRQQIVTCTNPQPASNIQAVHGHYVPGRVQLPPLARKMQDSGDNPKKMISMTAKEYAEIVEQVKRENRFQDILKREEVRNESASHNQTPASALEWSAW